MSNLRNFIILLSLLIFSGCNKLPDTWGAESNFSPFADHQVSYYSKSTYVYANNSSWTDSGIFYNSLFKATLVIFETSPGGYIKPKSNNSSKDSYSATASGTVSLCPQFANSQFYFSNWKIKNACQYINGVLVSEKYSINGVLVSERYRGANSGKVEYIISKNPPANTDHGTIITGVISSEGNILQGSEIQNSQDGKVWLRIIDEDGDYLSNYGRYKITVTQPVTSQTPSSFLSKLATLVIDPITKQIDYVSEFMFETGSQSAVFKNIIRAALILYIILYGLTFLMGFENFTQRDLIGRLIKVAVVLILISDTGINFFNDYLFDLFKNGQRELINIIADPSLASVETGKLNYNSLFAFANYAITTIFSSHFFSIIAAFLMWFPIGWVCLIMLLYSIVVYVFAILEVIIFYIISYTAIGLLIALGPVFIPLVLFDRTRGLFDGWIAAIVSYTMAPVIMFAGVILVTAFVNDSIYTLLTLELRDTAVLPVFINFGSLGKLNLFTIHWLNPVKPFMEVVTNILIFYIFIELLKKISVITDGISSTVFGKTGGASGLAGSMVGSIKSGINMAVGAPVLAAQGAYEKISNRKGPNDATKEGGKDIQAKSTDKTKAIESNSESVPKAKR